MSNSLLKKRKIYKEKKNTLKEKKSINESRKKNTCPSYTNFPQNNIFLFR